MAIPTAFRHCAVKVNLWLLGRELLLTQVLRDTSLIVLEGGKTIRTTPVKFSTQGASTPHSCSKIETQFCRHLATAW